MMLNLLQKELNDLLKSKSILLFSLLFFIITAYSFYSAVDLYSKASVAAIDNPLYATGFEPASGVFAPTLGGFFILLSLIAPFLFIPVISNEKKYNTLSLLAQFPVSLQVIFSIKFFAASIVLLLIISLFFPVILSWHLIGGTIPVAELSLLLLGYFLYGLLVIAISFFAASLFDNSDQASILALTLIIASWFLDFAKDMNIMPFLNDLLTWSITWQLKQFEHGILSLQSIIYFLLLITFFTFLAYIFFNFSIRKKATSALLGIIIFLLLFWLNQHININVDVTQSHKNSFSPQKTEFIKQLPTIGITIFLEKTDSRVKDYRHDFLKKLTLINNHIHVHYASGKLLKKNYGLFKYTIGNHSDSTFSNSEEEIFMILETLSGITVEKSHHTGYFKGYPLVVKDHWAGYFFMLYLILFPLGSIAFYFKHHFIRRTK